MLLYLPLWSVSFLSCHAPSMKSQICVRAISIQVLHIAFVGLRSVMELFTALLHPLIRYPHIIII